MALQERLVDILKANYKFWIIPNIVSYQLPVQYRVPALSVCGFVWSIYCSHFAKKCGDDVDSRQRQARAAQLSAKECSFEVLEDEQRDCLLGQGVFGDAYTPAANASVAAAALRAANAWANNIYVDEHGRPILDEFGQTLIMSQTVLPDGSVHIEADDAPRCMGETVSGEQGRRERRMLAGMLPSAGEGSLPESTWRERFDCWWLALPKPTQAQLGGCLGAVSLHLGSRFDAVLGLPSTKATDSPQECEWLSQRLLEKESEMLRSLQDTPKFPAQLTQAPLVLWPVKGQWHQLRQLRLLMWLRNNWADPQIIPSGRLSPPSDVLVHTKLAATPTSTTLLQARPDKPAHAHDSDRSWLMLGVGVAAGSVTAAACAFCVHAARIWRMQETTLTSTRGQSLYVC